MKETATFQVPGEGFVRVDVEFELNPDPMKNGRLYDVTDVRFTKTGETVDVSKFVNLNPAIDKRLAEKRHGEYAEQHQQENAEEIAAASGTRPEQFDLFEQ